MNGRHLGLRHIAKIAPLISQNARASRVECDTAGNGLVYKPMNEVLHDTFAMVHQSPPSSIKRESVPGLGTDPHLFSKTQSPATLQTHTQTNNFISIQSAIMPPKAMDQTSADRIGISQVSSPTWPVTATWTTDQHAL